MCSEDLNNWIGSKLDGSLSLNSGELCNVNESGRPAMKPDLPECSDLRSISDLFEYPDLQRVVDDSCHPNDDGFFGIYPLETAGEKEPEVEKRRGTCVSAPSLTCDDAFVSSVLDDLGEQDSYTVVHSDSKDERWMCSTGLGKDSYDAGLVPISTAFSLGGAMVSPTTDSDNARAGTDSRGSAGTAAVEVSEQQAAFESLGLPPPPEQKQQRASCQRASCQRAKRPWDACAADAAVAVAPKRGKGNRGAHVRHRPDMQQAARDGAAHWQQQLRQVRGDWAAAAANSPEFRSRYQPQLDAAAGNVKAKLECLLRTLQLAAHGGAILPAPAMDAAPAGEGFFGWAGFVVAAGRAQEWRGAVERLFPAGYKEETVRETFRRAGLVPAGWRWQEGWSGRAPFVLVVRAAPPPTAD